MMLALLSVAAGVMVLILAMGIMNGMQKEFEKKLFVMNYPLTMVSFDQGAINDTMLASLNKKFPELKLSPFYTTQVISKHEGMVQGTILYGIDSKKESAINPIYKKSLNDNDNTKDKFSITIGEGLSSEINVFKGDKILLYFSEQQAIGFGSMPLQKRFTVASIYKSGLKNYDKVIAYTTLEAFWTLLDKKQGSYDGVHIYAKEPMKIIEAIKKVLPQNVFIEGWWEQNGNFFSAMELEKKALFLVLLLIILIASLNIISSLVMTIMSRRAEIALMNTLGVTKKEIKTIFFKLGMTIGMLGIFLGIVLAFLSKWIIDTFDIISVPEDVYGTSKLPIDITLSDFSIIIIGAVFIVAITSLYPARKAALLDPLNILRNE
ncbi:MAG: ABC transporter permease [Campylobacterales bacterium]|nr:ABC transporter permease [Campylobacterales bacterium]